MKPTENELLTVNFDEFNTVVTRGIIATKAVPEDEVDFDSDDALSVDMGELGPVEPVDSYEPTDGEVETPVDPELEPVEDTEDIEETEDITEESSKPQATGDSLLEIYTRRNKKKKNKIVESLLVDNTVDTIEQIIKSSLQACGISKAETVVVLGLILDRMLHASDTDVVAPDFLDSTFGELITNKDVAKTVKKAVVNALSGLDNPDLNATWSTSMSEYEPETEKVKEVISKAVKDKPEEEE